MFHARLLTAACIASLAIAANPVAAAPVVANGDFEADSFPTWPGYVGQPGNPASVTGWVSAGGGYGINPESGGGGDPFRNNGNNLSQVLFLQGLQSLAGTISGLTPGNTYEVTFEYNARWQAGNANDAANILVSAGGGSYSDTNVLPVDPAGTYLSDYYTGSFQFVASATTETITINSNPVNPTDVSSLFDNFNVAFVVPEPSSAALLGCGIIGGLIRRRRS
jgi:hypothetical protein